MTGETSPGPLLVIAAVEREMRPLRALLAERPEIEASLVLTGAGKINAARETAAAIARLRPRLVVQAGSAGAYPGSGLRPGDVALATEEVLADEGAETPGGFLTLEDLGLPLARRGDRILYNRVPVDAPKLDLAFRRAGSRFRIRTGTLATVSCGSGTAERAAALERLWGALAESMEGAAAALACWLERVPFHEVRGISNLCGPRDPAAWDIDTASRNAAETALALLEVSVTPEAFRK